MVISVHSGWVGVARKVWLPRGAFGATLPPVFLVKPKGYESYMTLLWCSSKFAWLYNLSLCNWRASEASKTLSGVYKFVYVIVIGERAKRARHS